MQLPSPRGPLSEQLVDRLRQRPHPFEPAIAADDEDRQLALWLLQQLTYRPVQGVDPAWEDEPSVLLTRHHLEAELEAELRRDLAVPDVPEPTAVADLLQNLVAGAAGPSLSAWVEENAELDHLREFVVHRAAYQLQEADPHSFAIPRLAAGPAKTALLELQTDEYGGHVPDEAHAVLFRTTMERIDLEATVDLDRLPAVTLRTNTVLNLLARSRRLVGALVGHLAVFEMTSVEPMARYAAATRRLLGDEANEAARFYDVHVAADGYHGRLALDTLVTEFARQYPAAAADVLFGAAVLLRVEDDLSRHLLAAWERGRSSLRTPLPGSRLGPGLRLAG